MRYVLENETLRVEIESLGAELKSVKDKNTNQEYMWQGDPKFWGRTSPILFPFVGSLKDKRYTYEGKTYSMGQHGFARDMEFELITQIPTDIYFELDSTVETKQNYPFDFTLGVGYTLNGNELQVTWNVFNTSENEKLHFSIGAHPAFNCPIHGEESKAGYKLFFGGTKLFGGVKEIHHHGHTDTGLSVEEDLVLPLENHRATITPEFFDGATYIIERPKTKEIGVEDPEGNRFITVLFDMPVVALWSPPGKNAPFLCIEPWFGRCDAHDFEGTLEERAFNNVLEAQKSFHTSYTIRFGA